MFVIFLQQTVDEMGDVLEDRRRGRHIALVVLIYCQMSTLPPLKQVAQLSKRDRAAGCVSLGQKCETIFCRQ